MSDPNFGYSPAIGTIVDRFKASLADQCLPEARWVNDDTDLTCVVWEVDLAGDCDCDLPGRAPVPAETARIIIDKLSDEISCGEEEACADVCACALEEATGDRLELCRNERDATELAPGYCYIDPARGIGSPDLIKGCPANEQRLLRIVGTNTPRRGTLTAIACLVEG